jgi:hypothetical protein
MPVTMGATMRSSLCGRPAGARWALTACLDDPASPGAWRREILPVCPRCCRALDKAGAEGVKLKRTGER